MEDKAIRGIRWTLLGNAASRVGSLITTFVLARLIAPRDFGVVAFGSLVITVVVLFGTGGLGAAIVVRQDLSRRQLSTAFTLMVAAYLACAALILGLSPLARDVLNDPRAGAVLRALTIPIAFGGVTAFYTSLLQRELLFARQVACLGCQTVAYAITSIALAATGAGVWSLVIGQIVGASVLAAMLLALAPFRTRPGFDRRTARSVAGSGFGFVVQGGVSFVEQNADYAVIATKFGSAQLGVYSLTYRLCEVPYNFIVDPIAQATFPGFARMRHRSEEVAGAFLTTLRLTALCALPLGVIAAGAARPLVHTLLGSKWTGMIPLLQILGLWGSLRVVHATIGWFVNAMGYSSRIGASYAVMLVASLPLLVLAATLDGAKGVAWVMVGNVAVMSVIVASIAHRAIGISLRRQWDAIRTPVVAAPAAWIAAVAAAAALDGAPSVVALAASLSSGAVVYVGAVSLMDAALLKEARTQLRRLRRTPAAFVDPGSAAV